jgi:hypothetical protein
MNSVRGSVAVSPTRTSIVAPVGDGVGGAVRKPPVSIAGVSAIRPQSATGGGVGATLRLGVATGVGVGVGVAVGGLLPEPGVAVGGSLWESSMAVDADALTTVSVAAVVVAAVDVTALPLHPARSKARIRNRRIVVTPAIGRSAHSRLHTRTRVPWICYKGGKPGFAWRPQRGPAVHVVLGPRSHSIEIGRGSALVLSEQESRPCGNSFLCSGDPPARDRFQDELASVAVRGILSGCRPGRSALHRESAERRSAD